VFTELSLASFHPDVQTVVTSRHQVQLIEWFWLTDGLLDYSNVTDLFTFATYPAESIAARL
jgi:hypothetical protein